MIATPPLIRLWSYKEERFYFFKDLGTAKRALDVESTDINFMRFVGHDLHGNAVYGNDIVDFPDLAGPPMLVTNSGNLFALPDGQQVGTKVEQILVRQTTKLRTEI